MSGREIFAREFGGYLQGLLTLNDKFKAQGKPPDHRFETAPTNLEDDDLLEMVNAGLMPAVVVDDYLANFWKKVFPNLWSTTTFRCAPAARSRWPSARTIRNCSRP